MAARNVKLTRRLEDYLEAVSMLVHRDGFARVRDIAAATGVRKSTVTAALKHLGRAGLIHHDPYQLVTLTAAGEATAGKIRYKHVTLRRFLVEVLGLEAQTAEDTACRMEHVMGDVAVERIALLAELLQSGAGDSNGWARRFAAHCAERAPSAPDDDTAAEDPAGAHRSQDA